MLHKKVFKILSVLVAVIIAFSCCFISANAGTGNVYTLPCGQPSTSDNSGYAEFLIQSSSGSIFVTTIAWNFSNSYLTTAGGGDYSDNLFHTVHLDVYEGHVIFYPVVYPDYYCSLFSFMTCESGGYTSYSSFRIGEGYESASRTFFHDKTILAVRAYGNVQVDSYLSSNSVPFSVLYSEDAPEYNQLLSVVGLLNELAADNEVIVKRLDSIISGNQSINDKLTSCIALLTELTGSVKDDIIANQDENTDKVIQNQEENQEEIKNGWQQDEEIDTSTTDDYAAKDKELQDATEQGRSEAVSVFNSFGSLFQSDGHLYKGLLSVSAIFTQFMQLDWLSSLLNFSLAIGIFAFVIGTGSEIFKSSHERYKDDKISKIDSYDERWLM